MDALREDVENAIHSAGEEVTQIAAETIREQVESQVKSAVVEAAKRVDKEFSIRRVWHQAAWRDALCDPASGHFARGSFEAGLRLLVELAKGCSTEALLQRTLDLYVSARQSKISAATAIARYLEKGEELVVPCFVEEMAGCYMAVRRNDGALELGVCATRGQRFHAIRAPWGREERDVVLSCESARLKSVATWIALLSYADNTERFYTHTLPYVARGELQQGGEWRVTPPSGLEDDASGVAALLCAIKFASRRESVVTELRLALARRAVAEASLQSSLNLADRRALYAGAQGIAAAARLEGESNLVAEVASVAKSLFDLASLDDARYWRLCNDESSADVDMSAITRFPLFDGVCEVIDEDALAGGCRSALLVRPADAVAVGDQARTFSEASMAVRACAEACALLANDGPLARGERGRLVRRSLIEHLALRVLPTSFEECIRDEAERCELLRAIAVCAHHYAADATLKTRQDYAARVATAAKLLCVVDAVARVEAAHGDRSREDAFVRRYGGRADDSSARYVAGARNIVGLLSRTAPTLLLTDPACLCAIVAALDYFGPLAANAKPLFDWSDAFFDDQDQCLFGNELAVEYGLRPELAVEYVAGARHDLLHLAPALLHFRDAHAILRILLVADGLFGASPRSTADAAPIFSWDQKRSCLIVSVFGRDLTGLSDSALDRALGKGRGFFDSLPKNFSIFGGSRRGVHNTDTRASLADPSLLAGSPVTNESDVLHLATLPSFNDALSARDSELVLQYLTAQYCRIPLLLQFFSGPSRFAALGCAELQSVLDAAFFEPGQLRICEYEGATRVETAPAPKAALATRFGLIVNELINAPDVVINAVDAFLERIRELDPGKASGLRDGGHAAAITYAVRFLARLEGYVLLVLGLAPFPHALNLHRESWTDDRLKKLRQSLAVALRTEISAMLERWLRRTSTEDLQDGCLIQASLAMCYRYVFGVTAQIDGDAQCDAATRLLTAWLFLTQNWHFEDSGSKKKVSLQRQLKSRILAIGSSMTSRQCPIDAPPLLSPPASELFGCFAQNRCAIVHWARQGGAHVNFCFETIARKLSERRAAKGEAESPRIPPPDKSRTWIELDSDSAGWAQQKRGVGRFAPMVCDASPGIPRASDASYEAWLRSSLEASAMRCDVECDLQVGEFVVRGQKLQVLDRDISLRSDLADALEASAENMQCAELSSAKYRRLRRLVAWRVDVAFWDPVEDSDSLLAKAQTGLDAAAGSLLAIAAALPSWVSAVMKKFAPVKLRVASWRIVSVTDDVCAVCAGVSAINNAQRLRAIVIKSPPSLQIFNRAVHGRRAHWILSYASDAAVSFDDGHPYMDADFDDDDSPVAANQDDPNHDDEEVCAPGTIQRSQETACFVPLVVTRTTSCERLCPSTMLSGLLPSALLRSYRFWYVAPTTRLSPNVILVGEPRESEEATRLTIVVDATRHDATVSRDNDKSVLVNLTVAPAGTEVGMIAEALRALDAHSHVLAWSHPATDLPIDFVSLPRLKLSFRGRRDNAARFVLWSDDFDGFLLDPRSPRSLSENVRKLLAPLPTAVALTPIEQDVMRQHDIVILSSSIARPVIVRSQDLDTYEDSFDVIIERNDAEWIDACGESRSYAYSVHLSEEWVTSPSLGASLSLLMYRAISGGRYLVDACETVLAIVSDSLPTAEEQQLWTTIEDVTATLHSGDARALRLRLALACIASHDDIRSMFFAEDGDNLKALPALERDYLQYARSSVIDACARLDVADETKLVEAAFPASRTGWDIQVANRASLVRAVSTSQGVAMDRIHPWRMEYPSTNVPLCARDFKSSLLDDRTALEPFRAPKGEMQSADGKWTTEALSVVDGHHHGINSVSATFINSQYFDRKEKKLRNLRDEFVLILEIMTGHVAVDDQLLASATTRIDLALLLVSSTDWRSAPPGLVSIIALCAKYSNAIAAVKSALPGSYEAAIEETRAKLGKTKRGIFGQVKGAAKAAVAAGKAMLNETSSKEDKADIIARTNEKMLRRIHKALLEANLPPNEVIPISELQYQLRDVAAPSLQKVRASRLWDASTRVLPGTVDRSSFSFETTGDFESFGDKHALGSALIADHLVTTSTDEPDEDVDIPIPFDLSRSEKRAGTAMARSTLERLRNDFTLLIDKRRSASKSKKTLKALGGAHFDQTQFAAGISEESVASKLRAVAKTLWESARNDEVALRTHIETTIGLANKVTNVERIRVARMAGQEPRITFSRVVNALLSNRGAEDLSRLNRDCDVPSVLDSAVRALIVEGRMVARRRAAAAVTSLAEVVQGRKPGSDEGTVECRLALQAATAAVSTPRVTVKRDGGAATIDPRYVVFEFASSIVLRSQQHELVRTFLDAERAHGHLVHQMIMGSGKTTVVAPLLALLFGDASRTVTAVAPRSLIEMTRGVYRSQFSAPLLLRPVFTLEFQRTTEVTPALVRRLDFARESRAVIVAAPSCVKAFVLKFIELQHESVRDKIELSSHMTGQGFLAKVKNAALGDSRRRSAEVDRRERSRERERRLYAQAFELLHNGVALLDEVDLLLHPLKSELNWPSGSAEPLDFTAPSYGGGTTGARWRLPWFLIDAVLVASGSPTGLDSQLATAYGSTAAHALADALRRGFAAKTLQAVPHLVLLDRQFYETEMLPHLSEMLVSKFFATEGVLRGFESGCATKEARQYLTDIEVHSSTRVRQLPDEQIKYFNLGRGWLRTYLPWVLSKINRVGFGTLSPEQIRHNEPRGRRFLAVPFVGKDKPTEASEFSNPEVAIGLTILSLRYEGLRQAACRAMLSGLRDGFAQEHGPPNKRPSALTYNEIIVSAGGKVRGFTPTDKFQLEAKPRLTAVPVDDDEADLWQKLWPLSSLDIRDSEQLGTLHRLLKHNPKAVFRYLDEHAFPQALVYRSTKLSASGQVLGEKQSPYCAGIKILSSLNAQSSSKRSQVATYFSCQGLDFRALQMIYCRLNWAMLPMRQRMMPLSRAR